jgi:hypothetical protein
MRALLQNLEDRKCSNPDLVVELRGHQVDPARIQRWQKRHGREKDVVRPFASGSAAGKSSWLSRLQESDLTDCCQVLRQIVFYVAQW